MANSIGKMRYRVKVENATNTRDAGGGLSQAYTVASFVKAGGLEALFENQNTYTEIIDSVQNGIEWEGHMISIDEIQDEYVCHVKAVPVVNSNKDKLVELFFSARSFINCFN